MTIAVGADHAGFELKDRLAAHLRQAGFTVEDFGTSSPDSVDYPDVAAAVSRAIAAGSAARGLLVCGTGLGMAITANKIAGVRAVTCSDCFSARMARAHNDANVLTLGARVIGEGVAKALVDTFFGTDFEGARHAPRVAKIDALDRPTSS